MGTHWCSHHHFAAIKWNALFASGTTSPLPSAASATWKPEGDGAAQLAQTLGTHRNFHYMFFYISLPSVFCINCVCVCVHARFCIPSISLSPLPASMGRTYLHSCRSQLQNHNKISHECILGDISQMSSRLRLHTKYLGRACAQSIRSTSRFLCLRLNSAHLMSCFMHAPISLLDNRKRRSSTIVCAYSNIVFSRSRFLYVTVIA